MSTRRLGVLGLMVVVLFTAVGGSSGPTAASAGAPTGGDVATATPRDVGCSALEGGLASVDPPCGGLDGVIIDPMNAVGDWHVLTGGGAAATPLASVPGRNGQAVQLSYDLGATPGAWVQMRRDFNPPLDMSAGDHLRFFYQGTTSNTMEVGLVSMAGENYFASSWKNVTHVRWWTYATWDFQDFRKGDTQAFPDFGQVRAIFISVAKKDDGVGGVGSILVDDLQYLDVASRTVPAVFEPLSAASTVTQRAAQCIASQQRSNGLLKSWQEEQADLAWLYDQALGLIVFSESGQQTRAADLATALHGLQNSDGSWYEGYHTLSSAAISSKRPVGAIAWTVYALMRYALKSGATAAYQDAVQGAAWLASLQRPDGSLPGEASDPPDASPPTEANLDAWWAFQATGYADQADSLQQFLLTQVWDSALGRFQSSGNTSPPSARYGIFLDNQTWGAAFLKALGEDAKARQALSYARWNLVTNSSDGSVCGFDGAGPFSVWNEGTLQYVAARGENSQHYWNQMAGQQAPDGCMPGSPDDFSGYIVWLTRWHGIAPTAWLYFAGTGGPFHVSQRTFLPLVEVRR